MSELMMGRTQTFYKEAGAAITVKEILGQPDLWVELADLLSQQNKAIQDFVTSFSEVKPLRIIFTGAGSSEFIGVSMQSLLGRELGLQSESIATTDIVSAPDSILHDVPTLLVSFSRSGESPESMAAIQYAVQKVKKLYNLAIVCKAESTMAKFCQKQPNSLVLEMPKLSSDLGFAMTGSVSSMALAAWCVFGYGQMEQRLDFISMMAGKIKASIDGLDDLAREIVQYDFERLVYLGSGALKGLAEEGSVKSLELTNGIVFATYNSPMGFRHGPKTLLNSKTLTVHFLSPLEPTLQYDLDLLQELNREKKGNRTVALLFSGKQDNVIADYYYSFEAISLYPEMAAYLQGLVFLQLLSLETSLKHHVPTDNPSVGGEVNRVVQGVNIYPLT